MYEKKFVAFIDILGFKNIVINTTKSGKAFKRLHNALSRLHNDVKDLYGAEVSIFSDSIIISYMPTSGLFYILINIVHICIDLSSDGYFCRGGVVFGDIYHKGNLCFGPAMNQAYCLEEEKAIYPRIIVEKNTLIYGAKYHVDRHTTEMELEYLNSLVILDKNEDNIFILNFLGQSSEFDYDYYSFLAKIKNYITCSLMTNEKNEKILKKYIWLVHYFNWMINHTSYTCDDTPFEKYDDVVNDLKISLELLRIENILSPTPCFEVSNIKPVR